MKKDDEIRLRHMLEAARDASRFTAEKTRSHLDRDKQLVLALVKCVEIIGEAAASISDESKAQVPGVPWPRIVAMRNILVHEYFRINLDIVWSTVKDELPPFITQLRAALPPEEGV